MKQILISLIEFYQKNISAYTTAKCRYQPTCSNYMLIAIQRFGTIKGIMMGCARILRCNPFVKGGYDPVPTHFKLSRNNSTKN